MGGDYTLERISTTPYAVAHIYIYSPKRIQRAWRYAVDQIARTPKQIGDAIRRQRRKLGLNQRNFSATYNVSEGAELTIPKK